MKNLPFSKQWPTHPNNHIRLYLPCNEAWQRAKREVNRGSHVLLFPEDACIGDYYFPVEGHEVFLLDLDRSQEKLARLLGEKLILAGATMAVYLGHLTIFFKRGNLDE